MIEKSTFVVKEGGIRLDAALLLAYPTTTRSFARAAIAAGDVLVARGGAPQRALKGAKLRGGETIVVRRLTEAADNVVRASMAVDIDCVFEDSALLAFNKPSGIAVQPLSCNETNTLMNGVVARYGECATLGDRPLMAGALHRIDAGTSGLVLVARTAESFANVRAQFAAHTVRKTYLALVEGDVAVGATLENDLVHDPTVDFCRMVERRTARFDCRALQSFHAVTRFRPVGHLTVENESRTLLEVEIFTGVTHQIRAQLALAGHHIVNDRLYGAFAVENQVGHALHALAAAFKHPVSGDSVEIRTPWPSWASEAI